MLPSKVILRISVWLVGMSVGAATLENSLVVSFLMLH